jgi:drug/metabolite transporter (DMT)-like permease
LFDAVPESSTPSMGGSPREPYLWAVVLAVLWVAIVAIVAAAASDDDPAIEAGTIVFVLPLASFALSVVAGVRGRELKWTVRFAVATALSIALAYTIALLVRWEPGAFYIVPIIALVLGVVLWLVSGGGWVLGTIVRSGLGLGDDEERDESHDPNRL